MREKLDCLGLDCPLPVIKAKKALAGLKEGVWLDISVDGDTQVQNLTRLANNMGYKVEHEPLGNNFLVKIEKGQEKTEEEIAKIQKSGKTVIVFAHDLMGSGDDELGRILMKSFCFSITQMDPLPETLIFYNGGVHLTTEGSPVLVDLENLAKAGVEIFSCGTCLKHLGIEDKLKIGDVSNMYEILEMQMKAAHIIMP